MAFVTAMEGNFIEVGEEYMVNSSRRVRPTTRTYGLEGRARRLLEEFAVEEASSVGGDQTSGGVISSKQFVEEEVPMTSDTGSGREHQPLKLDAGTTTAVECKVGDDRAQSVGTRASPPPPSSQRRGVGRGRPRVKNTGETGCASGSAQVVGGSGRPSQLLKEMVVPITSGVGRGRGQARPMKQNFSDLGRAMGIHEKFEEDRIRAPATTCDSGCVGDVPELEAESEVGGDEAQGEGTPPSSSKTSDPGVGQDRAIPTYFLGPEVEVEDSPPDTLTYQQMYEFFTNGCSGLVEAPAPIENDRRRSEGEDIIVHSIPIPINFWQRKKKPTKRSGMSGYCLFLLHKARQAGIRRSIPELMGLFTRNWEELSEEEREEWKECSRNGEKYPRARPMISSDGRRRPPSSKKGEIKGLEQIDEEDDEGY